MSTQSTALQKAIEEGNEPLRRAIDVLTNEVRQLAAGRSRGDTQTVERPAWTDEEATNTCEVTGVAVPTHARVPVVDSGGTTWEVHPGVASWMARGGNLSDLIRGDVSVENVDLSTPLVTVSIRSTRPPLVWTFDKLPTFSRGQIYQVAKQLNLRNACMTRHIDYRRETSPWVIKAIAWLTGRAKAFPEPMAEDNRRTYTASNEPPPKPKMAAALTSEPSPGDPNVKIAADAPKAPKGGKASPPKPAAKPAISSKPKAAFKPVSKPVPKPAAKKPAAKPAPKKPAPKKPAPKTKVPPKKAPKPAPKKKASKGKRK